jgi:hypothetical protein
MTLGRPPSEEATRLTKLGASRLSAWRNREIRRQATEQFPLFRGVDATSILKLVEFLDTLTSPEAIELLVARGEEAAHRSPSTIALLDRFDAFFAAGGGPRTAAQAEGRLAVGLVRSKEIEPIVVDHMNALLGRGKRQPRAWQWVTRFSNLTVITYVDFRGSSQMTYQHNLHAGSVADVGEQGPESSLISSRNGVLLWLGAGIPRWDLVTSAGVETAAKKLTELCSKFLAAIPELYGGERPSE